MPDLEKGGKVLVIRGSRSAAAISMIALPILGLLAPGIQLALGRPVPVWAWGVAAAVWVLYLPVVVLAPVWYRLELSRLGVSVRVVWRTTELPWIDIEPDGFHPTSRGPYGIPIVRLIGVELRRGAEERGPLRTVVGHFYGSHFTFPHVFAMPRDELIDLLNEWQREQYAAEFTG